MENQDFKYFAFISYSGKDEKWAKWLHSHLEHYHIPAALCKEHPNIPKKIRPVFWYKKDLSGTKLKDALNQELGLSKYLIVICSPESAKSEWVNDEIQSFIDGGKSKYIIPFIVNGIPHSDSIDTECFPPSLRNLPREEEIRGISVKSDGKQHALVDVVATMFGVSFDTLWQRHKRRQKIVRNIWMAACLLCCLCTLCIWDYTRTKVEYYDDWVDKYGIAEGITPLSKDQVNHRYYSYKFEYSRVPFGEKGFYSWRLNKVSIVNSKGVISNYTPDNHEFFYPIQEYKYTDGYVTEIINRDAYNRVALRYSIKDDYEQNIASIVDIEGKEKHQGSAYISGSTTALISNESPNMSKIKRFHYTRNGQGYITKITFHANDADELDESAIGDNNNIYGKLFCLDELGRITKVTYVNHEGNPMTDKYGVMHIRYNNAPFNGNDTTEYLGSDGNLAFNEHKYARLVSRLDRYGNPIEQRHYGVDGKPCFNNENIYRQVHSFDNNGCLTEYRYYDFDGKPSFCANNYSIQRVKYDSKGRFVEVSYYDVDSKRCYTKGNYSLVRVKYNSNDCIVEQYFYDISDKPCIDKYIGAFCIKANYDEYNYKIEESIWGKDNEPTITPKQGFHLQKITYDSYHRIKKIASYDSNNNPCINTQEFRFECRFTYDTRGNLIKIENLDTNGKPCVCKEGYATIRYKFDNFGNKIEESFWGINNDPIYINNSASIKYDYYPNGLLKENRFYDKNNNLCLNNNWYAISQFEYDINGNQTKVSFFDTDTVPCYYKDGLYSSLEFAYDRQGNICKEIFYDSRGNISLMNKGQYAIGSYEYDNYRHITKYAYFNEKGMPCYYDNDYHILRLEYDAKGNVKKYSIYGVDGNPILGKEGTGIIQYTYDNKDNIIRVDFKDIKGININQKNKKYSTEIVTYDNMNNIIQRAYYDMHGKPCMINPYSGIFFSSSTHKYDMFGNCTQFAYFDVAGKPTKAMPYALKCIQYDDLGRIIEEKYKQYDGKLAMGGNHHMALIRYKYDKTQNYISDVTFYDPDSVFQAHLHQTIENGHITRNEIRDKSGKLKSMYIYGFTDVKYAVMTDSINDYGLNVKRSYYGDDGKLGNTEDGVAVLYNTYDQFGRLTKQELFDKDGRKVNSMTMKYHKRIRNYNRQGLLSEESFFDNCGNYVNTPVLNGLCKSIIYYDERGCVNNSSSYFVAIDGKAVNVKDYNQYARQNEERKTVGTLILASVEFPGLFIDNGYEGIYGILEWNGWNIYHSIIEFAEAFSSSLPANKHLLLIPITESGLGEAIEVSFPPGSLGIRIVEGDNNSLFNGMVDIYEDYKIQRTPK